MKKMTKFDIQIGLKTALVRFLRVIIPQLPTIINYLTQFRPEWTPHFVFLGAILTAIDKFCREIKLYGEFKI